MSIGGVVRIRKPCGGFTMVEMLVALVVLAVGMLGVASLFAVTLQSSGSAISRMQAVNLASDIADRIRANRKAGAAYEGMGANNNCAGKALGTVKCTADQMAANDIFVWQQQIAAAFPGGSATGTIDVDVAVPAALPSTYTITLTWSEAGTTDKSAYTMIVQAPTN
jgi:type IV pilus assembly protein PilV